MAYYIKRIMRNYQHNWILVFTPSSKKYIYNMTVRADDGDQRFDPENTKPDYYTIHRISEFEI